MHSALNMNAGKKKRKNSLQLQSNMFIFLRTNIFFIIYLCILIVLLFSFLKTSYASSSGSGCGDSCGSCGCGGDSSDDSDSDGSLDAEDGSNADPLYSPTGTLGNGEADNCDPVIRLSASPSNDYFDATVVIKPCTATTFDLYLQRDPSDARGNKYIYQGKSVSDSESVSGSFRYYKTDNIVSICYLPSSGADCCTGSGSTLC
jgi:hypothetical protein